VFSSCIKTSFNSKHDNKYYCFGDRNFLKQGVVKDRGLNSFN